MRGDGREQGGEGLAWSGGGRWRRRCARLPRLCRPHRPIAVCITLRWTTAGRRSRSAGVVGHVDLPGKAHEGQELSRHRCIRVWERSGEVACGGHLQGGRRDPPPTPPFARQVEAANASARGRARRLVRTHLNPGEQVAGFGCMRPRRGRGAPGRSAGAARGPCWAGTGPRATTKAGARHHLADDSSRTARARDAPPPPRTDTPMPAVGCPRSAPRSRSEPPRRLPQTRQRRVPAPGKAALGAPQHFSPALAELQPEQVRQRRCNRS